MDSNLRKHRSRARPAVAAAIVLTGVLQTLIMGGPARAGNIFDDDWTPPKRAQAPREGPVVPVPPPPDEPNPATPERVAKPPMPPVNPPETVAAPPTNEVRRPIPDKANTARCRKLFKEVFAEQLKDHSVPARRKLAQSLLDEAGKAMVGSPDRFVLLNGAMQAAEEAKSLRMCFAAATLLAKTYEADELAAKAEATAKTFAGPASPALSNVSNVEALMALVDQLVDEDDFATLTPIEAALQRAMPAISDADLKTEAKNQIREVAAIRDARANVAPALDTLKKSPGDPTANLVVGSYLCFDRGRWDKGLPLLAMSKDAPLRDLATAELMQRSNSDETVRLADRWLAVAGKLPAPHRNGATQHAADLYRAARSGLSGLEAMAIEKKLSSIPPGRLRRVDLLRVFDPARNAVKGGWRMEDDSLVCEASQNGRIEFGYQPPEEYDFRITFTSPKDVGAVVQICSCAGRQFSFDVGGWDNQVSALEYVDGTPGVNNKTARRKDRWMVANKSYTAVVKVRKAGVEAYLDGQLVTSLKTDYSDVSVADYWRLPHETTVGVATDHTVVHFDRCEIVEVTGKGKLLSP